MAAVPHNAMLVVSSAEVCSSVHVNACPICRPLELISINVHVTIRTRTYRTQGHAVATILYARVSTAEQTIEHQLAHARSAGLTIDEVVADNGVSGLHSRLVERTEGRRLFDKLRAGDVLVVRWVDRLGRNYEDV